MANYPSTTGAFPTSGNNALNTAIQSEMLKVEAELSTYFTSMTANMSKFTEGDSVPAGVVMRVDNEFANGGDEVRIPYVLKLLEEPTYGDGQGEGNEEDQRLRYFPVKLNQIKHQVKSSGRTARRRIKNLNPFKAARPQLAQWFATEIDFEHMRALARGWSNNLLAATASGGLAVNSSTQVSHPNMFVAGLPSSSSYCDTTYEGMVAWSGTAATYESYVAAAVNELPTDTSGWMSLQLMDSLIPFLPVLELEPIKGMKVNGNDMYVFLMHPNAWEQLRMVNSDLYKLLQYVDMGKGDQNRILSGKRLVYRNFILEVNQNVPGCTSTGSAITYGLASSRTRDTYAAKLSFILGQGALAYANGEGLRYETRDIDYKSFEGVQAHQICGVQRVDWKRDDNTSNSSRVGVNVSSAAIVTYSPTLAVTSGPRS